MRRPANPIFPVILALGLGASVAFAQDFSNGSNAKEWGLIGEVKATFSGKVVDILCEVSGDCAENCGDGNRQLGILRDADNALVAVLKNRQAAFNGAVEDLLPYCNQRVDVDGVLVGDEDLYPVKYYMVQFIRPNGTEEWRKTTRWTKRWAVKNPDAGGKGPWFRRDPRVKKQLAETGYFGLGLEADKKYRAEYE